MARRRKGSPIHGWLVLDKPQGMTSTQAVSRVRHLYGAQKAGHAGTLDPLATGVLPIAFGEATKTVPFAVDGDKQYRFTVRFGEATDTDDSDGTVIATSDRRPSRAEIEAALPELRRRDQPGAAALFGAEGGRRQGLRPCQGRPGVRACRPAGPDREPRAYRHARRRPLRHRGALRQGHLCAGARPRPRGGARHASPMSRNCAERGSDPLPKRPQFPWQSWRS